MPATHDPGIFGDSSQHKHGPTKTLSAYAANLVLPSLSKQPAYVWLSVTACLFAGGAKPTYSQLLELQSQAQVSPIKSPLLPELVGTLFVADQWLQRCTEAIARRSAQTLKSCLEAMAASVQRAQEQMEAQLRKLQVRLLPRTPPPSPSPLVTLPKAWVKDEFLVKHAQLPLLLFFSCVRPISRSSFTLVRIGS